MRLTLLYGPPAAGKHTVGQKLSDLTGYKFFYNHLTVDVAKAIFPVEDDIQSELKTAMRLMAISMAARENVNLIFTLAYSGVVDDKQIQDYVNVVEGYGGVVDFVQIFAPVDKLMERVENKSRKKLKKLSSKERLKKRLQLRDHYAVVKHERNLKVDTSLYTVEKSAHQIINHYKYPLINKTPVI